MELNSGFVSDTRGAQRQTPKNFDLHHSESLRGNMMRGNRTESLREESSSERVSKRTSENLQEVPSVT